MTPWASNKKIVSLGLESISNHDSATKIAETASHNRLKIVSIYYQSRLGCGLTGT